LDLEIKYESLLNFLIDLKNYKIFSIKAIFAFVGILIIIPSGVNSISISAQEENENPQSCIAYFYGHGCPHCAKVEPVIEQISVKYPELEIRTFEIYENRTNTLILRHYDQHYSVPIERLAVPIIFVGDKHLVGSEEITENLENTILENSQAQCLAIQTPLDTTDMEVSKESKEVLEEKLSSVSLLTIIAAALVDSINPCAIAVLLILISALIVSGGKKKAIKAGLAFTVSIYFSYLLFGLGLMSALQISGLSFWFHQIVGYFAIAIGIFNLKDYFWYGGGGFVIEIPRSWRPSVNKILQGVTTPIGAFAVGFVISLFELPCTGGPYIFILGLLSEQMTQIAAIPILLLYNLFFVLPLLVITFLVFAGFTNIEKTKQWKEKNIRKLHLVTGIVMVILGLVVIIDLI
jgi:cytochrome c biogenesis protein CcdA/glutaredoxin